MVEILTEDEKKEISKKELHEALLYFKTKFSEYEHKVDLKSLSPAELEECRQEYKNLLFYCLSGRNLETAQKIEAVRWMMAQDVQ